MDHNTVSKHRYVNFSILLSGSLFIEVFVTKRSLHEKAAGEKIVMKAIHPYKIRKTSLQ